MLSFNSNGLCVSAGELRHFIKLLKISELISDTSSDFSHVFMGCIQKSRFDLFPESKRFVS